MSFFSIFNRKKTKKIIDEPINPLSDGEASSLEHQFTKMALQSLKFNSMVMEYLDSLRKMLQDRNEIISKLNENQVPLCDKNEKAVEEEVKEEQIKEKEEEKKEDQIDLSSVKDKEETAVEEVKTEIPPTENKSETDEVKADITKKVIEVLKSDDISTVWPSDSDDTASKLAKFEAIINNKAMSKTDRAKALKMKFDMLKNK